MAVGEPLGVVDNQIRFHSGVMVSGMGNFQTVKEAARNIGKVQESTRKGNLSWVYHPVHRTLMAVLEDHCSTVEMGWNPEVDEKVVDEEGLTGKIAEGKVVLPGCSLMTVVEAEEVAVAGIVVVEEVAGKGVGAVTELEEEEVDKEAGLLEAAGTDQAEGNKALVGEQTGWEAETVVKKVQGDCAVRRAVGYIVVAGGPAEAKTEELVAEAVMQEVEQWVQYV